VDYGAVIPFKRALLSKAFAAFEKKAPFRDETHSSRSVATKGGGSTTSRCSWP
jgi:hypothetical protein